MWAKAKRSLTLLKAANKSVVNTETDNNNKVANNNDTDGNRQQLSSPLMVTVGTNDGHNVSIDSAYDSAADLTSPTLLTLRRPKPLATTVTAAAVPLTPPSPPPPSASNGHHNGHHHHRDYHRPQQHQPYEQIILKKVNGREMILNTGQSVGFLSHPVGYYVRDLGNRSAAAAPPPQPRPTTTTANTNAGRKSNNNNNNTIGDYGGGGGGHRFVRNGVNRRSFDLPSPGGGGDYRRPQQHRNHNQLTTKSSAAATSTTNSTTITKDSVVDGRPKRFQSMSALPMITISADMSSMMWSSAETKRKVILVSPPKPKVSAKMKSSISSMEEITRERPLMDIDDDSDDNESVYFDSEHSLPPPLSAPIGYPTMATTNTTTKRLITTTTAAKRCLISTRSSIKRVVVNTVDDTDSDD